MFSTILRASYYTLSLIPFVGSAFFTHYVTEKCLAYYDARRYLTKLRRALENWKSVSRYIFMAVGRALLSLLYYSINPVIGSADFSGVLLGFFIATADILSRERNAKEFKARAGFESRVSD